MVHTARARIGIATDTRAATGTSAARPQHDAGRGDLPRPEFVREASPPPDGAAPGLPARDAPHPRGAENQPLAASFFSSMMEVTVSFDATAKGPPSADLAPFLSPPSTFFTTSAAQTWKLACFFTRSW